MSNLKDLVYGYEAGSTIKPAEFVIENTQTWVPHNGGCGYTWTVPAGIQHALFEVWSGGAGGGFSCCWCRENTRFRDRQRQELTTN